MKTSYRILLGLAVLSQFAGFAAFLCAFLYIVSNAPPNAPPEYFERSFAIGNLVGGLFTFYCAAILVLFVVHAARNRHIAETGMRTTWLLLLIILGPWVMPFYWYLHIWREPVPMSSRRGPLGLN